MSLRLPAKPLVFGLAIFVSVGAGLWLCGSKPNHRAASSVASLGALVHLPSSALEQIDIGTMNLLCAQGLPGAESFDLNACLVKLDKMAARVRSETERHYYRFQKNPAEFENSEGFFRMLMLAVVLAEDFGVRYAPSKIGAPAEARMGDGFFADARDVFLQGLVGGRSSSPSPNPAPEPASKGGKDAFHRVPDFAQNKWDAVERVLTRFRGARRVRNSGNSLPEERGTALRPALNPPPSAVLSTLRSRATEDGLRRTGQLSALNRPNGTCSSLPVLQVAVGRRLGYPLKLVTTKGHLFVRWEGAGERFNIEAAGNGVNRFTDDYYRHWPLETTPAEEAAEGYLKSLTPPEELAVFLSIRGMCLREAGRLAEAADAFAAAARFVPACRGYQVMLASLHGSSARSSPVSSNLKNTPNERNLNL